MTASREADRDDRCDPPTDRLFPAGAKAAHGCLPAIETVTERVAWFVRAAHPVGQWDQWEASWDTRNMDIVSSFHKTDAVFKLTGTRSQCANDGDTKMLKSLIA